MALVKQASKFVKKGLADEPKEKKGQGKAHHFLVGLKDWAISPGGIITILSVIGIIWYIHHKLEKA